MKFKFRFASVLKVRRYQEKEEKQKLGALLKKKKGLERDFLNLKELCQSDIEESKNLTMHENRRHYAQKHTWHKQLARLSRLINQLNNKLAEQRNKLAEAYKKTRMMEKLKDNEKKSFIQYVERVEQHQQNEIAIQRYNTNY
ncbi:MAG TPA: hypothetical protein VK106_06690 [Balneolaceae bacterium]|nr:hypothetical protein [Balneolaceae bacterium]